MTKLQTKNRQMTSRRAVAPVIATLLLVAIAVVGGSIIFVFSQGFFSSAQISGSPQIESVEIVGYDARDIVVLELHDGEETDGGAGLVDPFDGNDNDGLLDGERLAIYVQNQSAQKVSLTEVSLAGNVYTYVPSITVDAFTTATMAPGDFAIISQGVNGASAVSKTAQNAELEAGEEATILVELNGAISFGRDAQFKMQTANGAIFVGTIIAGQQSG